MWVRNIDLSTIYLFFRWFDWWICLHCQQEAVLLKVINVCRLNVWDCLCYGALDKMNFSLSLSLALYLSILSFFMCANVIVMIKRRRPLGELFMMIKPIMYHLVLSLISPSKGESLDSSLYWTFVFILSLPLSFSISFPFIHSHLSIHLAFFVGNHYLRQTT